MQIFFFILLYVEVILTNLTEKATSDPSPESEERILIVNIKMDSEIIFKYSSRLPAANPLSHPP